MQMDYVEVVALAERLHRQFLEVIQLELDVHRIRDINNVQALILNNLGDEEMTISELMWRGCYLGSNVSYNLKKLTEAGYIDQERSAHDKRVTMVRLSQKGMQLCAILKSMNERHSESFVQSQLKSEDLATCRQTLRGLQQLWNRTLAATSSGGPLRLAA